ncbi:MAG: DUF72 domain-containing protein [Verrucomicrobiae bacterium]|nr:DUF72 domain-containing protein [Verrucomicrobiae bacterium]
MAEAQILIGTAGWSYADWENVVYPVGQSPDRLRWLAQYLDCVEVDASFYRPLEPRIAESWLKRLADRPRFRFLAKAWQRFTHERKSPWTRSELELGTRGLEPLRAAVRLDALLFQFPWSFRNDAPNREWLTRIAGDFAGWPVAVELRHDSWLRDETIAFFREWRLIFCNIDQPALEHCIRPTAHATTDTGYYRLHGRNAANWFRKEQEVYGGRYDYLYSDAELDGLLTHIRRVASQTKRTFVVFNNHRDAKAFANALGLQAKLAQGSTVRAPSSLLARYPQLRGRVVADGEEHLTLM